jgi:hypothetical protein
MVLAGAWLSVTLAMLAKATNVAAAWNPGFAKRLKAKGLWFQIRLAGTTAATMPFVVGISNSFDRVIRAVAEFDGRHMRRV